MSALSSPTSKASPLVYSNKVEKFESLSSLTRISPMAIEEIGQKDAQDQKDDKLMENFTSDDNCIAYEDPVKKICPSLLDALKKYDNIEKLFGICVMLRQLPRILVCPILI